MNSSLSTSELLEQLSVLVNRWSSHDFRLAHASRLHNERDFTANKLLYLLGAGGPMRPSELATVLGTGRANVSKTIARLESDGLISREPDPSDARASLVALTDEGRVVSADVFRIGGLMLAEITHDWTDAERRELTALLRRLNAGGEAYEAHLRSRG
jgi:DNA-binding MarR family transcriptional regulator